MIRAYNLETKKLVKEYSTMEKVADDFDLTIEAVKSYFYRYKLYGEAKIKNHNTGVWCYLEKPQTKKVPNYKERCLQAIEYIRHAQNYGTMAQVMPHLKPYVNGDDLLEILGANDENIR